MTLQRGALLAIGILKERAQTVLDIDVPGIMPYSGIEATLKFLEGFQREGIVLGRTVQLIARDKGNGGPKSCVNTPKLMGIRGGGTPAEFDREVHSVVLVIVLMDSGFFDRDQVV